MKKIRKGDLKLIQEHNRTMVLNKIRTEGPISRIELAKSNHISPSTVASAVQELIKEGYVSEIGTGISSGGRKPVLLKFNPNHQYLFAVAVTNSLVILAQMNLEGSVHRKSTHPISGLQGDALVDLLLELMDSFIGEPDDPHRCIGISVTVPGIVDDKQGIVYYNSKLRMSNVPLKQMLEDRYGLKTWLENDMNAVVLAERRFGNYPYSDLIYISIGDGLGSGILINDRIMRGVHGGAGEFGHTSVTLNGIRCECGNVGCLDSYISWIAVYSRILTAITTGRPTVISKLIGGDYGKIVPAVYLEALRQGDRLAQGINEEVAEYLGAGIVNLINLFNPRALILGGEMAIGNAELLSKVQAYIEKHAMMIVKDELVFGQSSLGEHDKLMGAAAILLQDVLGFSITD
ncbi:ROK family transcriptional regulator [Paenibacillus dakarensis]|uniref:ROK family transcriptional regulator n=1 Tax=Paenibacillus dakarensis TaxID=1527293 RepID=UPI0012E17EF7|nr:ROK family transcriptional regulator [Paenibacillus dakarensis]